MQITNGFILLIAVLSSSTGCQPGPDRESHTPAQTGTTAKGNSDVSCLLESDSFGYAEVSVLGASPESWIVDSDFGLSRDSTTFFIRLSEPEIGHFELALEAPGRNYIPAARRYTLHASERDTASHSLRGRLSLFRESDETYLEYAPRVGEVTITSASWAGLCGDFEAEWELASPTSSDSGLVRTTGLFRAVPNQYVPSPGNIIQ